MEKPTTKNTLPSKALIQIGWRNQKLYRQAKAKRIQHNQTSFTTNAKGTSLGRKETSNLKQPSIHIDCYIKTSWEKQTKKLQEIHTHKRKSNPNTTPKIVIQITKEKEEGKKKDLQKQIENN